MTEPAPRWHPSAALRASAVLHAAALVSVGVAPGRWPWAAAAVAVNHALLTVAGLLPRSRVLGPNLTRLPASLARVGQVALTIDDGPDAAVTPRVLDVLRQHDATASFFLIGRRAERHPDLVAEIVRQGHQVENHTYSHANTFALQRPRGQARDIDRSQRLLTAAAGRPPAYFRPPAGIRGPLLERLLHQRGLTLASWTRRGFDTVDGCPGRVASRLTHNLGGGDILLLHDGNAARDAADEPVILRALPRVLEALDTKGLRAVALPRQIAESVASESVA